MALVIALLAAYVSFAHGKMRIGAALTALAAGPTFVGFFVECLLLKDIHDTGPGFWMTLATIPSLVAFTIYINVIVYKAEVERERIEAQRPQGQAEDRRIDESDPEDQAVREGERAGRRGQEQSTQRTFQQLVSAMPIQNLWMGEWDTTSSTPQRIT